MRVFVTGGGRGFVGASCRRRARAGAGTRSCASGPTSATATALVRGDARLRGRRSRGRALQLHGAGRGDGGGERRRHAERDRRLPRDGGEAARAHEHGGDVRPGGRAVPRPRRTARRRGSSSVPYKRTKLEAERLVLAAAAEGLDALCVNPTTPIGEGDRRPTPTGRMVRGVASGRYRATLRSGGLNLVDVRDVARGHVLALERGRAGERYLLGGDDLTLAEVFALIARAAHRPPPRIRLPHAAARALRSRRARERARGRARASARLVLVCEGEARARVRARADRTGDRARRRRRARTRSEPRACDTRLKRAASGAARC